MGFFKSKVERLVEKNDVRGLIDLIRHGDEEVHANACKALREMELVDIQAIHLLCDALEDGDEKVSTNASLGLGLVMGKLGIFQENATNAGDYFNKFAPKVIESLVAILGNDGSCVRRTGVIALSQLSPSFDVIAANELVLLLRDSDKSVQNLATRALFFWGVESRNPVVLQALDDSKSIAYYSQAKLNKSLREMFKEDDLIQLPPRKIDRKFLDPFKGMGLNQHVEEELGSRLKVEYEKFMKSKELSQDPELSSIENEFYGRISEYWHAYLSGKDIL